MQVVCNCKCVMLLRCEKIMNMLYAARALYPKIHPTGPQLSSSVAQLPLKQESTTSATDAFSKQYRSNNLLKRS